MQAAIHLLDPGKLTPDKYYKVYPSAPSLLFIKIGGQFYDEETDNQAPFVVGLLMMALRKTFFNKRKERHEASIDRQVGENPDGLLVKKSNFALDFTAIQKIEMNTKSSFHTNGTDRGSLLLHFTDGTQRKFIIPSFMTDLVATKEGMMNLRCVATKSVINFFESQGLQVDII